MQIHVDSRNLYVKYNKKRTDSKNKKKFNANLSTSASLINEDALKEEPKEDVIAQFFNRQLSQLTHDILNRYMASQKNIDYTQNSIEVSLNDSKKLEKLLNHEGSK